MRYRRQTPPIFGSEHPTHGAQAAKPAMELVHKAAHVLALRLNGRTVLYRMGKIGWPSHRD